jgi:cyanate permease
MKITGIVLFWVGVVAILVCILALVSSWGNMLEPESAPIWQVLLYGTPIGFIFVVIGAILYFVGRSQSKKQKNQNSPLV